MNPLNLARAIDLLVEHLPGMTISTMVANQKACDVSAWLENLMEAAARGESGSQPDVDPFPPLMSALATMAEEAQYISKALELLQTESESADDE